MNGYTENELKIIEHFKAFKPRSDIRTTKYEQYLSLIPQEHKKYKCHNCYTLLNSDEIIDGKCVYCGEEKMLKTVCPIDHNGCSHPITEGISICPICGEPTCVICHDHAVVCISRVTGSEAKLSAYFHRNLSDVAGWNSAKRAELNDRVRSNLNSSGEMINTN